MRWIDRYNYEKVLDKIGVIWIDDGEPLIPFRSFTKANIEKREHGRKVIKRYKRTRWWHYRRRKWRENNFPYMNEHSFWMGFCTFLLFLLVHELLNAKILHSKEEKTFQLGTIQYNSKIRREKQALRNINIIWLILGK